VTVHHAHRDFDAYLGSLLRHSWIGRALMVPARHLEGAWEGSRTRHLVLAAAADLQRLSIAHKLQVAAVGGAVAMVLHIVLVLVGARTVEPLTLVVPTLVLVVCVVGFACAARVSQWLERVG
jgi:hypothetical protein